MSTNVQFLMSLCEQPELLKGNVHTGFIEEHKSVLLAKNLPKPELISQVIMILNSIVIINSLIPFHCYRQLLLQYYMKRITL